MTNDERCDVCGKVTHVLQITIQNRLACPRCYDRETMDERDIKDRRREEALDEQKEFEEGDPY
jgi:DNA-directed RNA polymerase subunit M/transcription elongation factor TFIIS